jgi:hypothetical protein
MRPLLILLFPLLLAGCGALQLDPAWLQNRPVASASDSSKTVRVTQGMVFYDASPATRGIRFPPGVYSLEAEDSEYWYFRSPAPLEFRTLQGGRIVDGRDIPGGLMISKRFSVVPGAGYIDGDVASVKMAVWKLGREWLVLQGKEWQKSF